MRIYSTPEIHLAEKFTMERQQISSEMLMERAAIGLFEWIDDRLMGGDTGIHLFCGIGNNGGDGMALARLLLKFHYEVKVHVVNFSETRAEDFLLNMERLKQKKLWPEMLKFDSELPEIDPGDMVVDAIFGIGLNRPPDPWVGRLIEHINASGAFVLSVDIPSGLPMDQAPWNPSHVIKANVVLSFQWPKLPFFLPENELYIPHWWLLDIGMEMEFPMGTTRASFELMGKQEVLPFYRPRRRFSHKGDFGHSLIIGGSHGKMGAVQLAAAACLVAGSGKVTAYVPECGYHSIQTAQPEIMVLTDEKDKIISKLELPFAPTAIGIGVGMGVEVDTVKAFASLLKETETPMVIDADALNILWAHPELLGDIPEGSILTPHPKELERLLGKWKDDYEKLEKAADFAQKYRLVLIIKGAHSIILYDGQGYINGTGNPGMATAGSGDVLTGLITGLLAQGYAPLQAAIFGVFLHGAAGDLCAAKHGFEAVVASKIVKQIGKAYKELYWENEDEEFDDDDFDDDFDNEYEDEGF